jgi:hypothetical protein
MGVKLKLLRVGAVSSSLLLVATFVAYRAGSLGRWFQAESTAVAATPSPETESASESQPEKPIMGGSKSLVLVPLSEGRPTPREPRPRPRPTPTKSPDDKVATPEEKDAPSKPPSKE